jgi:hypothetical protein
LTRFGIANGIFSICRAALEELDLTRFNKLYEDVIRLDVIDKDFI